ncbi:fibronectin type III domain-containing protein [Methanogenium marinum]|uniref:Fibronectin type III domain-containing protein n=1 Tax=Methanogenium marinum TaxID=348610 RepID=A0A9Q4PYJ5_9EURY|nr:fibronectin type III domain-containing protein [Methanogenium marinum]MDE4908097.1 fibronectin type III domain-containing protein [Methanogenium marinum]
MRGRFLFLLLLCLTILLMGTAGITGAALTDTATVVVSGHVPLWIYDVQVVDVTSHAVGIAWKTNGASTSQVAYDTESRSRFEDYFYPASGNVFSPVYEHIVLIEGLTADETYFFRVRSEVDSNEAAVSDEYTFTTPEEEESNNNCWRWRWRHGWGWTWGWGWRGGC